MRFHTAFFLVIVPVHVVVVRCDGAAMHEDIWLTVNLNVDIQRQAVKIIEYLLTDRLSNVFYILVRDIPAVSVPKSQSMWILWIVFSKPVQGIQHHVFVIAQKHLYVGHMFCGQQHRERLLPSSNSSQTLLSFCRTNCSNTLMILLPSISYAPR